MSFTTLSGLGHPERRDAGPLLLQRDGRRAVNERGPDRGSGGQYVNEVTEEPRYFGYILELQPGVQPDNKPHLRLVH